MDLFIFIVFFGFLVLYDIRFYDLRLFLFPRKSRRVCITRIIYSDEEGMAKSIHLEGNVSIGKCDEAKASGCESIRRRGRTQRNAEEMKGQRRQRRPNRSSLKNGAASVESFRVACSWRRQEKCAATGRPVAAQPVAPGFAEFCLVLSLFCVDFHRRLVLVAGFVGFLPGFTDFY